MVVSVVLVQQNKKKNEIKFIGIDKKKISLLYIQKNSSVIADGEGQFGYSEKNMKLDSYLVPDLKISLDRLRPKCEKKM